MYLMLWVVLVMAIFEGEIEVFESYSWNDVNYSTVAHGVNYVK